MLLDIQSSAVLSIWTSQYIDRNLLLSYESTLQAKWLSSTNMITISWLRCLCCVVVTSRTGSVCSMRRICIIILLIQKFSDAGALLLSYWFVSFDMNSLWRLNVLKHRSFVCVMGGVDPFCTIEPAEWSECSNMISKCRPGIVQTFCSSLFCPHPPTTIIQADYNKTQSGFFENHLALVWLITYWWCNARSVFYIRGRETDKKSFHVNNPLCFYNNPIKIALVFLVQPTVYLWLHAILRWPRQIKSFKGLICDFYIQ